MLPQLIVEALLGEPLNWAPPALPEPIAAKPVDLTPFDTADWAIEYMEGEVGRHDWQHNWPQHKTQHGNQLREKVIAWLRHYEADHDPDAIIRYLDDLLVQNPEGRWT